MIASAKWNGFLNLFHPSTPSEIMNKLAPESELEEAVMVNDLWEGQNFLLSVKRVSGFVNYDNCKFFETLFQ